MGSPFKGRADYLAIGDFNAACSMCGRKRKASTLVKNWQGFYRCPEHNEPRQPQDFVRAIADVVTPPWVQLEMDINIEVCTYNGISAVPGWAIPGCSIPGRTAIQPVWGYFSFNFTQDVGGLSAGTLREPIQFLVGTYLANFNDGESRYVTFAGTAASWTPALTSPNGVTSIYTNIGTY
jgi:hypothetical protein